MGPGLGEFWGETGPWQALDGPGRRRPSRIHRVALPSGGGGSSRPFWCAGRPRQTAASAARRAGPPHRGRPAVARPRRAPHRRQAVSGRADEPSPVAVGRAVAAGPRGEPHSPPNIRCRAVRENKPPLASAASLSRAVACPAPIPQMATWKLGQSRRPPEWHEHPRRQPRDQKGEAGREARERALLLGRDRAGRFRVAVRARARARPRAWSAMGTLPRPRAALA